MFFFYSRSNNFFETLKWNEDIFNLKDDHHVPSVFYQYQVYQLNDLTLFSPSPIDVPRKFLKNHKETQLLKMSVRNLELLKTSLTPQLSVEVEKYKKLLCTRVKKCIFCRCILLEKHFCEFTRMVDCNVMLPSLKICNFQCLPNKLQHHHRLHFFCQSIDCNDHNGVIYQPSSFVENRDEFTQMIESSKKDTIITIESDTKNQFYHMISTIAATVKPSSFVICGHNEQTYCSCFQKCLHSDEAIITVKTCEEDTIFSKIKEIPMNIRNEKRARLFCFHEEWTNKKYKISSVKNKQNKNMTNRNIKTIRDSMSKFNLNLLEKKISFPRKNFFLVEKNTFNGISMTCDIKPSFNAQLINGKLLVKKILTLDIESSSDFQTPTKKRKKKTASMKNLMGLENDSDSDDFTSKKNKK